MKYFQDRLENILYKTNKEGNFKASIISSSEGIPIASVSSLFDSEIVSALASIVQDVSIKAQNYIGLKKVDEISFVDNDKIRLICREFKTIKGSFLYTVVVPPYKNYRRLTNKVIREMERLMNERMKPNEI
jgi:predicted regulator of Ras-like GTPase activity (Roadblock/LC7/MglB family)